MRRISVDVPDSTLERIRQRSADTVITYAPDAEEPDLFTDDVAAFFDEHLR